MAQFIIPIDSDLKHYEFFITLDGDEYLLKIAWNIRADAFFISVYDSQSSPIIEGIQVVEDTLLFQNVKPAALFPGDIMVVDTENYGTPPKLGDLGTKYTMFYMDRIELATV